MKMIKSIYRPNTCYGGYKKKYNNLSYSQQYRPMPAKIQVVVWYSDTQAQQWVGRPMILHGIDGIIFKCAI